MPLPDLSVTIAQAQRVVLLLAASDVTLLRIKVPPLSHAKLKAALPNLVEDQLIADASDCTIIAGELSDGLRTIAVMKRTWLDTLSRTLISYGAHQIAALPAQLCLPCQPDQPAQHDSLAVAVNQYGDAIDMTLRLSEHDGIGLTIGATRNDSAAHEAIQALCAVVPESSIVLYVAQPEMHAYQKEVNDSGMLNKRINVSVDNWSRWISGANDTTLDLMAGLGSGTGPKLELRAWRWPLALAVALMLINIAALNIDWWRMKSEANSLRASMIQIYRSAFPKENVIIDPVAQMKQKIAAARHDAGMSSPDDFTALTAAFGDALASIAAASGKPAVIASLEYREQSLFVKFKPNAEAPAQQMKIALTARNLSLDQETSGSAAVWKIRSMK